MTEPKLFGRPMSGDLAPWPGVKPTTMASPVITAATDTAPAPGPRIRFDWRFFAVAAVLAAIAVAILFMISAASATRLPL